MFEEYVEKEAKKLVEEIKAITRNSRARKDSKKGLLKVGSVDCENQLAHLFEEVDRKLSPSTENPQKKVLKEICKNKVIIRIAELLNLPDETLLRDLIKESNNKYHMDYSKRLGKLITQMQQKHNGTDSKERK